MISQTINLKYQKLLRTVWMVKAHCAFTLAVTIIMLGSRAYLHESTAGGDAFPLPASESTAWLSSREAITSTRFFITNGSIQGNQNRLEVHCRFRRLSPDTQCFIYIQSDVLHVVELRW